jgi:tetratricopeptide (TPR) repeat protein
MMLSSFVIAFALVGQAAPPPATNPDTLGEAYFLFLEARELEDQDVDAAIAEYRKAAELAPGAAEIHAELALAFGRRGNTEQALAEANRAIEIDPKNVNGHRVRGLINADLADSTQDKTRAATLTTGAIADLEVVAAERVVDRTTDLTLGRLYVSAGEFAKAIERLNLFLLDRPDYPQAMMLLADAYEGSHQLNAAIDALETVVAQTPDQPRVWARLAGLQEQAGRWSESAVIWNRLASAPGASPVYRTRQAIALVNAGNLAAGRELLATMTAQQPRDLNAWYLLAQVDRREGHADRAADDARQIIGIDPSDVRGPLALADALDMSGDAKGAVTVLENARRQDAGSVDLLFRLAAAYDRVKKFDQAERALRQVLAQDPNHADALNYLGYMLAERGTRLDEAITLINKALTIEPDNPSFLDSLGWAYVKDAKLGDARAPLERAAQALPTTSVIQDHLAELYFRLDLYPEAAAAWDRALAGDRSGIDATAITKKRDRAKALAEKK